MDKQDLIEYKKKLAELSEEEKRIRNIYLKKLQDGRLQGPPVNKSSIDRNSFKHYTDEELTRTVPRKSVYQFFLDNTKEYDDLLALEYFNKKVTYREFKQEVEKTKKALAAQGVKPGDVVSVCLPNMPEVGYIFYALNDMGAVANMLDPRTNESTLCRSVDDAKSDLVISLDSLAGSFTKSKAKKIVGISAVNSLSPLVRGLVKAIDKTMRVKLPKDKRMSDYAQFMKEGEKHDPVPPYDVDPDAPAAIAYTGGTTGSPKGVIMTNNAFNSMIVENTAVGYNADPGDVCLGMAPPWTFYGLSNSFNTYLSCGVCVRLIPKFGPDDLGMLVKKYRPNHIISVPTALVGMINEEGLKDLSLSFLKTVIVGADKLSIKLEEEFNAFLERHNCFIKVSKGYGMTETCAAASYSMKDTNVPGTVGIPFLLENIAIFNPEDPDDELDIGESGEVAILGPKNMVGYFGENEGKTGDVLKKHADGTVWAHTGDLGHMDKDGLLYIDGRLKRMFVKGGFKIFPGEIETQILKHPDVEQAAVVSVENESMGFIISGYITLKQGTQKTEEEIINEVNQILLDNMYDYELPDSIKVVDSFPLTGMQKIDYIQLGKQAAEECKNISVRKI